MFNKENIFACQIHFTLILCQVPDNRVYSIHINCALAHSVSERKQNSPTRSTIRESLMYFTLVQKSVFTCNEKTKKTKLVKGAFNQRQFGIYENVIMYIQQNDHAYFVM